MKKLFDKKYSEIITREAALNAWQEFVKGKKHKVDVGVFSVHFTKNIENLYLSLISKTYIHSTYHHFRINDPKPRDIHKATVADRIVHHLLYNALYDYFDQRFIHDSYSCRIGKGTHKALERFRSFSRTVNKNNTKQCYILKCDIKKFFASIDHEVLKHILKKHIHDINILWLLENIIDSFNTQHTQITLWRNLGKGLPLGNLTSQLLVNMYMNEFDQYIKHELKVKYYIRYADDFVIFSNNKLYLENLITHMSDFLNQNLKLELHPNKVFIKTIYAGVDFLGWIHFPTHRVLRTATKKRMFKKLKKNNYKEESLNSYLGMLSHGNSHKLKQKVHGIITSV